MKSFQVFRVHFLQEFAYLSGWVAKRCERFQEDPELYLTTPNWPSEEDRLTSFLEDCGHMVDRLERSHF
ncbi:hypothetical protein CEXT_753801 [Caerostris extrusa]|uniref:Uncharacterized protein n=1 Tax=Caerostris extrusa TaxID=172846 RepID=A0AAV4VKF1_CAEEX|nr:hypothetical protein CEXT_753801 [Caerostris extrusa]